jgi:DNA repair exonuclease SbcCD ATPase subunit
LNPIKLEVKNFFSHKNSVIDFNLFNSALLIGNIDGNYNVSNGSGKSAIFEAVLWALFNKSRAGAMDDIIMWGEDTCEVNFIFRHEELFYKILRTRSRITSTSNISFSYQDTDSESLLDDGNWIDISGSTSKLTNSEIVKRIKFDYKTFVNSAYFRQNDISEFAESDPSRKKDILKSIIDISKWDEYEREAKYRARDLNAECKILLASTEEYDHYEEALENSKEELISLNKILSGNKKKRTSLEDKIKTLSSEYNEMKNALDTSQWDRVMEKLESLKKDQTSESLRLSGIKSELLKYKNLIVKLDRDINGCREVIDRLEVPDDIEGLIDKSKEALIGFKSSLSSHQEMLSTLSAKKIAHEECYTCGQDIDEILYNKLLAAHNEELDSHRSRIIYFKNKVAEASANNSSLEGFLKNKRKRAGLLSKIKSMTMEREIAEENILSIKARESECELKLASVIDAIDANNNIIESLKDEDFQVLHDQIEELFVEKRNLVLDIERGNRTAGGLTEKVANYGEKVANMEASRKVFLKKQDEVSVLEKTAKLFGKNGIQTLLLDAVIQDLEETANDILVSICNEPFSLMLETQRLGSDGITMVDTLDLRVKKDGLDLNFKSLSSGEQFRVSLALRIALSEISSRHGGSSLEFLLLDEIDSPLDRNGT